MQTTRAPIGAQCPQGRPILPRVPCRLPAASRNFAPYRRQHMLKSTEALAASTTPSEYPHFMGSGLVQEITDPDFHVIAKQMRRVPVSLPSLAKEGPLNTAVVGPTGSDLDAAGYGPNDPVVVLLHSFDSNSLEWRRLYPKLTTALQLPVVAVDLAGWGFTDSTPWRRDSALPLGPALKREHLECFRQQQLGGRPVVLVGTSLGGTIAADYALAYPEAVKRLVLLDPQGFTSGVPVLPRPLAWLGVWVLQQIWLRKSAGEMSYYDVATYATDDAWRIGRLATHLPGWHDANIAFISSGGYDMSEQRIKQLQCPILMLWGEQDQILPKELPGKWQAALSPSLLTFKWIPKCGHSPHLEQSELVAEHMINYLDDLTVGNCSTHETKTASGSQVPEHAGKAAALASN